jgi:molybdopterin converting factor small subunit
MKTVNLHYFAVLREHAGKSGESRETDAQTFRELYDELRDLYEFPLDASRVRVAIGETYGDMDQELVDGISVTFIPPVAGG